ncbi:MAG: DUF5615 family PIN-like protein [Thermoanaerobaculia bacterium]
MKLLFDANLSAALCCQLGDVFSGSLHVADVRLSSASDDEVWEFARQRGLTICRRTPTSISAASSTGLRRK